MRFRLGPLDVEAGGVAHKRLGLWIPDGLHIWLGRRGVHMFWARSRYMPRVTFETAEEEGES